MRGGHQTRNSEEDLCESVDLLSYLDLAVRFCSARDHRQKTSGMSCWLPRTEVGGLVSNMTFRGLRQNTRARRLSRPTHWYLLSAVVLLEFPAGMVVKWWGALTSDTCAQIVCVCPAGVGVYTSKTTPQFTRRAKITSTVFTARPHVFNDLRGRQNLLPVCWYNTRRSFSSPLPPPPAFAKVWLPDFG